MSPGASADGGEGGASSEPGSSQSSLGEAVMVVGTTVTAMTITTQRTQHKHGMGLSHVLMSTCLISQQFDQIGQFLIMPILQRSQNQGTGGLNNLSKVTQLAICRTQTGAQVVWLQRPFRATPLFDHEGPGSVSSECELFLRAG